MRRTSILLAIATIFIASSAFASDTKLVTTSKNPAAKPAVFNKVVVVVAAADADLRRRAEGGLARRVKNAVAATTLIPDVPLDDREGIKKAIRDSGADGVLLVRPLGITEDVNMEATEQYVVEYPSLWSYWDSNYMVVTRPGAVTIEKVVTLEIAIFSVASEQVVWAGRAKTTNPKSLRLFLDEIVKLGSRELKKQGLVA